MCACMRVHVCVMRLGVKAVEAESAECPAHVPQVFPLQCSPANFQLSHVCISLPEDFL